ncbi:hypothetical protein EI427_20560 [Flammeovirga pectinis]|uniref:Uncharacterized protein n=1 Tax=Flammeovirga pectinis TaxID=2494373 RepID=A0A3Q9FRT8_9BACT|nr:hypothetical protein [Flammeovirga pectinis]AZQ64510.1 hypothetical protein EI427_20560 [Flammeovirga pectinis]
MTNTILFLLTYTFLSFPNLSSNSEDQQTKLLLEVINHQSQNLNGLEVEIYQDDGLIARLNTKKITAISLPLKKYKFVLYYCNDVYKIEAKLFNKRHHMVFVVDEKECKEMVLISK